MPVHSDSYFRDAFLEGAARAYFVTAYADWCEEDLEDDGYDYPRASCGEDWMDVAPVATPGNAYALAGELWALLSVANPTVGCGVYSLAEHTGERLAP